jgi:hypothetical protein
VETSTSYIEVKQKTPNDRTIKSRIRTVDSCTLLAPPEISFVDGLLPIRHEFLETKLSNGFHRITLVNESHQERLTIDLNLSFHSEAESIQLPNVVVAELKQPRASRGSAFSQAIREQGVRPSRFSKYCVGVSLLYPMVKHNNFKPELRLIERLMGDN